MNSHTPFSYIVAITVGFAFMLSHGMDQQQLAASTNAITIQEPSPTLRAYFNFYEKLTALAQVEKNSRVTVKEISQAVKNAQEALKPIIREFSPNNATLKAFIQEPNPKSALIEKTKKSLNAIYFSKHSNDFPIAFSWFIENLKQKKPDAQQNIILIMQQALQQNINPSERRMINNVVGTISKPRLSTEEMLTNMQSVIAIFNQKALTATLSVQELSNIPSAKTVVTTEEEEKEAIREKKEEKKQKKLPKEQRAIIVWQDPAEIFKAALKIAQADNPNPEIIPISTGDTSPVSSGSTIITEVPNQIPTAIIPEIKKEEMVIEKPLISPEQLFNEPEFARLSLKASIKSLYNFTHEYSRASQLSNLQDIIKHIMDIARNISAIEEEDKKFMTKLCQSEEFLNVIPVIKSWLAGEDLSENSNLKEERLVFAQGFKAICKKINTHIIEFPTFEQQEFIAKQPDEQWVPASKFPKIEQVIPLVVPGAKSPYVPILSEKIKSLFESKTMQDKDFAISPKLSSVITETSNIQSVGGTVAVPKNTSNSSHWLQNLWDWFWNGIRSLFSF